MGEGVARVVEVRTRVDVAVIKSMDVRWIVVTADKVREMVLVIKRVVVEVNVRVEVWVVMDVRCCVAGIVSTWIDTAWRVRVVARTMVGVTKIVVEVVV